ncbi:MAG: hypothetical protein RLZZ418_861 [Pseudomonadota bacterium]|jgi:hypothetical protein
MEIEYQKLLDLEKLKSKALDELLEFQRNNTQKDLLDYKAPDIYQRYLALKYLLDNWGNSETEVKINYLRLLVENYYKERAK